VSAALYICHTPVLVDASMLMAAAVLYHQPEKMVRSKEDLAERQENLERLKQQHGIE